MSNVIGTIKTGNTRRLSGDSQQEQGGSSGNKRAEASAVACSDEQITTPELPAITYIKTDKRDLYSEPTIEGWLSKHSETISSNRSSKEHLIAAALHFVEEHLREKLGCKLGAEVELKLDTNESRSRAVSLAPQAGSYADFAGSNMRFKDLRLEVRGTTFLTLSLWDVPKSARDDRSWPPVLSVCVDCPGDAWTVPAIGACGVDEETKKAVQGFFDNHSLNTDYPVIQRKKGKG